MEETTTYGQIMDNLASWLPADRLRQRSVEDARIRLAQMGIASEVSVPNAKSRQAIRRVCHCYARALSNRTYELYILRTRLGKAEQQALEAHIRDLSHIVSVGYVPTGTMLLAWLQKTRQTLPRLYRKVAAE